MGNCIVNVARDFSRSPGGRFPTDGPFCGEIFRNTILIPALKEHVKVSVELDGVFGYGSSFLEEAFGGLVRSGFEEKQLRDQLMLLSDDPSYVEEIWQYIADANRVTA